MDYNDITGKQWFIWRATASIRFNRWCDSETYSHLIIKMWFPDSQRRHRRQCSRSDKTLIIYLLWFITFSQLLSPSVGFFFPLFANFFNKLRGNVNQNRNLEEDGGNGGASLFGGGSNGNATSIRVPMLRSAPERRIDVVTTVVNNAAKQEPQIQVLSNVSTTVAAEALLNSKLVAPTSTSITKSVSMSKNKLVPSPFFQKPPAVSMTNLQRQILLYVTLF